MSIRYISIREFSDFHQLDAKLLESIIEFGLVELHEEAGQPCIREEDIEPLESMIRLHEELGINLAGIDAIMHMRRRLARMQERLRELEYKVQRYERLRRLE